MRLQLRGGGIWRNSRYEDRGFGAVRMGFVRRGCDASGAQSQPMLRSIVQCHATDRWVVERSLARIVHFRCSGDNRPVLPCSRMNGTTLVRRVSEG